MGKNVFGGKNSKKFARSSNTSKDGRNKLRGAEEEGEMYAIVVKMLGNGCSVHCADDVARICLIRGKFQGKGKSMNIIEPGAWILVGLRDWETVREKSIPKCDLLEVYSHVDKERLKSASTDVDWDILMNNDITNLDKMNGIRKPENVHFMTEREEDYLKTMEKAMSQASSTTTTSQVSTTSQGQEKVDRVYVDDI